MSDCLFCKMVSGEIQPDVVYEDDDVLAFRDVNPQAPLHVLVIPKTHIATTNDLDTGNVDVIGKLYLAARQIAMDEGVADPGYRMVMNCNPSLIMIALEQRSCRYVPGLEDRLVAAI
jgi:histidine triad (HIT) family protein